VGVAGLEADGELYAKRRRRLGVDGGPAADVEAIGCGRVGDTGRRGDGGVTSAWRMDVKMALASSNAKSITSTMSQTRSAPFRASDSEGMILFFEGVNGPPSSIR
jgi:hypothetical protein